MDVLKGSNYMIQLFISIIYLCLHIHMHVYVNKNQVMESINKKKTVIQSLMLSHGILQPSSMIMCPPASWLSYEPHKKDNSQQQQQKCQWQHLQGCWSVSVWGYVELEFFKDAGVDVHDCSIGRTRHEAVPSPTSFFLSQIPPPCPVPTTSGCAPCWRPYTHAHPQFRKVTYIYIYIYICVCVWIKTTSPAQHNTTAGNIN